MPPALSDYGSELDDWGSPPSPPAQQSVVTRKPTQSVHCNVEPVTRQLPKKVKRTALLAGLDQENVILEPEGEVNSSAAKIIPLTSSIPTSSHRTRAQVSGSQRSELRYNQRYHPMDDYLRPKQAAKVRHKYGSAVHGSDDSDITTHEDDENESECETDIEDNNSEVNRRVGMGLIPLSSQPTRRSSRAVNRNVLYNTSVHPQDKEIKEIERTNRTMNSARKRFKISVPDSDDDNADENDGEQLEEEQDGDDEENKENDHENNENKEDQEDKEEQSRDSAKLYEAMNIPSSEGSAFVSADTSPRVSPTPSTIGDERHLRNGTKPTMTVDTQNPESFHPVARKAIINQAINGGQVTPVATRTQEDSNASDKNAWPTGNHEPFTIYEDNLTMQHDIEAAGLLPIAYDDDDKENNAPESDCENARHFFSEVSVVQFSQLRERAVDSERNCDETDFGHFTNGGDFESRGALEEVETDSVLGIVSSGSLGLMELERDSSTNSQSSDRRS